MPKKIAKTILPILIIVLSVLMLVSVFREDYKKSSVFATNEENLVGNICEGTVIKQTFTAEYDGLSSVDIQLATYARKNNATISYTVCDADGNVIKSDKIKARSIADNEYRSFRFSPVKNSKGKMYSITVTSDGTAENSITAWASKTDTYSGGVLYINGNDAGFDMAFNASYSEMKGTVISVLLAALLIAVTALFILTEKEYLKLLYAYFVTVNKKLRSHKASVFLFNFYVVLALLSSLLFPVSALLKSKALFFTAVIFVIFAVIIRRVFLKKAEQRCETEHPVPKICRSIKAKHFSSENTSAKINSKAASLANKFAVLALIFGIVIIFITPPMSCPDDDDHFTNVMRIANGDFLPSVENGQAGSYLTEDQYNLHIRFSSNVFGYNLLDYATVKELLSTERSETKIFVPMEPINPLSYNAAALGGWIGANILGIENAYSIYLLARISNLILFIFAVKKALEITPIFKNTMFLIALMPMTVYQCSSLSYDTTIICGSLLLFAYIAKLVSADSSYKIKNSDIVGVAVASLLLFCGKLAYFPLIVILLGISIKKFGNTKRYITCISIVAAAAVIGYLIPAVLMNTATKDAVDTVSENVIAQKEYFMNNLHIIPDIFITTFRARGRFYISSAIGNFGWLDTPLPQAFIIIYLILLILTAIFDACVTSGINLYTRLSSLFVCALIVAATVLIMYLEHSPLVVPVGGLVSEGVQGRYFIPILIFFALGFSNSSLLKFKHSETVCGNASKALPVISAAFLCVTVLTLFTRYWI